MVRKNPLRMANEGGTYFKYASVRASGVANIMGTRYFDTFADPQE